LGKAGKYLICMVVSVDSGGFVNTCFSIFSSLLTTTINMIMMLPLMSLGLGLDGWIGLWLAGCGDGDILMIFMNFFFPYSASFAVVAAACWLLMVEKEDHRNMGISFIFFRLLHP